MIFFSKSTFIKNYFRTNISESMVSDQAQHLIGPDIDPNCLQRLSADNSFRQRVKYSSVSNFSRKAVKLVKMNNLNLLTRP